MIWLAARYHFPSTYTCRMPMSSPVAARALPTPGPATIRLALIRNAIELFGLAATRDELFPVIRAMPIRVQPPERVAISQQQLRLYKGSIINGRAGLQAGLGYREVAAADGPLIVYLQVSGDVKQPIEQALYAVGAWGSADSLTYCERVGEMEPPDAVLAPLQSMSSQVSLSQRFIGLAAEFRDQHVTWDEIGAAGTVGSPDSIVTSLWAWPLQICERRSMGLTLRRCSQPNR